ncbi:gyf domain-containing protein [Cystoisospora suis]|uniref:Gyf domain-containing protein n=1 Tax=Cystoisospora suis TaxID=483139 RepID=A0A2C6KWQ7_9APIC|nr:gyf domain-containing protein [Cystoisospora suis]
MYQPRPFTGVNRARAAATVSTSQTAAAANSSRGVRTPTGSPYGGQQQGPPAILSSDSSSSGSTVDTTDFPFLVNPSNRAPPTHQSAPADSNFAAPASPAAPRRAAAGGAQHQGNADTATPSSSANPWWQQKGAQQQQQPRSSPTGVGGTSATGTASLSSFFPGSGSSRRTGSADKTLSRNLHQMQLPPAPGFRNAGGGGGGSRASWGGTSPAALDTSAGGGKLDFSSGGGGGNTPSSSGSASSFRSSGVRNRHGAGGPVAASPVSQAHRTAAAGGVATPVGGFSDGSADGPRSALDSSEGSQRSVFASAVAVTGRGIDVQSTGAPSEGRGGSWGGQPAGAAGADDVSRRKGVDLTYEKLPLLGWWRAARAANEAEAVTTLASIAPGQATEKQQLLFRLVVREPPAAGAGGANSGAAAGGGGGGVPLSTVSGGPNAGRGGALPRRSLDAAEWGADGGVEEGLPEGHDHHTHSVAGAGHPLHSRGVGKGIDDAFSLREGGGGRGGGRFVGLAAAFGAGDGVPSGGRARGRGDQVFCMDDSLSPTGSSGSASAQPSRPSLPPASSRGPQRPSALGGGDSHSYFSLSASRISPDSPPSLDGASALSGDHQRWRPSDTSGTRGEELLGSEQTTGTTPHRSGAPAPWMGAGSGGGPPKGQQMWRQPLPQSTSSSQGEGEDASGGRGREGGGTEASVFFSERLFRDGGGAEGGGRSGQPGLSSGNGERTGGGGVGGNHQNEQAVGEKLRDEEFRRWGAVHRSGQQGPARSGGVNATASFTGNRGGENRSSREEGGGGSGQQQEGGGREEYGGAFPSSKSSDLHNRGKGSSGQQSHHHPSQRGGGGNSQQSADYGGTHSQAAAWGWESGRKKEPSGGHSQNHSLEGKVGGPSGDVVVDPSHETTVHNNHGSSGGPAPVRGGGLFNRAIGVRDASRGAARNSRAPSEDGPMVATGEEMAGDRETGTGGYRGGRGFYSQPQGGTGSGGRKSFGGSGNTVPSSAGDIPANSTPGAGVLRGKKQGNDGEDHNDWESIRRGRKNRTGGGGATTRQASSPVKGARTAASQEKASGMMINVPGSGEEDEQGNISRGGEGSNDAGLSLPGEPAGGSRPLGKDISSTTPKKPQRQSDRGTTGGVGSSSQADGNSPLTTSGSAGGFWSEEPIIRRRPQRPPPGPATSGESNGNLQPPTSIQQMHQSSGKVEAESKTEIEAGGPFIQVGDDNGSRRSSSSKRGDAQVGGAPWSAAGKHHVSRAGPPPVSPSRGRPSSVADEKRRGESAAVTPIAPSPRGSRSPAPRRGGEDRSQGLETQEHETSGGYSEAPFSKERRDDDLGTPAARLHQRVDDGGGVPATAQLPSVAGGLLSVPRRGEDVAFPSSSRNRNEVAVAAPSTSSVEPGADLQDGGAGLGTPASYLQHLLGGVLDDALLPSSGRAGGGGNGYLLSSALNHGTGGGRGTNNPAPSADPFSPSPCASGHTHAPGAAVGSAVPPSSQSSSSSFPPSAASPGDRLVAAFLAAQREGGLVGGDGASTTLARLRAGGGGGESGVSLGGSVTSSHRRMPEGVTSNQQLLELRREQLLQVLHQGRGSHSQQQQKSVWGAGQNIYEAAAGKGTSGGTPSASPFLLGNRGIPRGEGSLLSQVPGEAGHRLPRSGESQVCPATTGSSGVDGPQQPRGGGIMGMIDSDGHRGGGGVTASVQGGANYYRPVQGRMHAADHHPSISDLRVREQHSAAGITPGMMLNTLDPRRQQQQFRVMEGGNERGLESHSSAVGREEGGGAVTRLGGGGSAPHNPALEFARKEEIARMAGGRCVQQQGDYFHTGLKPASQSRGLGVGEDMSSGIMGYTSSSSLPSASTSYTSGTRGQHHAVGSMPHQGVYWENAMTGGQAGGSVPASYGGLPQQKEQEDLYLLNRRLIMQQERDASLRMEGGETSGKKGSEGSSGRGSSLAPPLPPQPPKFEDNTPRWYYRDPSGEVQGPFPSSIMHHWWQQEFFPPHLKMRCDISHPWIAFGDLYPLGGVEPFTRIPSAQRVAKLHQMHVEQDLVQQHQGGLAGRGGGMIPTGGAPPPAEILREEEAEFSRLTRQQQRGRGGMPLQQNPCDTRHPSVLHQRNLLTEEGVRRHTDILIGDEGRTRGGEMASGRGRNSREGSLDLKTSENAASGGGRPGGESAWFIADVGGIQQQYHGTGTSTSVIPSESTAAHHPSTISSSPGATDQGGLSVTSTSSQPQHLHAVSQQMTGRGWPVLSTREAAHERRGEFREDHQVGTATVGGMTAARLSPRLMPPLPSSGGMSGGGSDVSFLKQEPRAISPPPHGSTVISPRGSSSRPDPDKGVQDGAVDNSKAAAVSIPLSTETFPSLGRGGTRTVSTKGTGGEGAVAAPAADECLREGEGMKKGKEDSRKTQKEEEGQERSALVSAGSGSAASSQQGKGVKIKSAGGEQKKKQSKEKGSGGDGTSWVAAAGETPPPLAKGHPKSKGTEATAVSLTATPTTPGGTASPTKTEGGSKKKPQKESSGKAHAETPWGSVKEASSGGSGSPSVTASTPISTSHSEHPTHAAASSKSRDGGTGATPSSQGTKQTPVTTTPTTMTGAGGATSSGGVLVSSPQRPSNSSQSSSSGVASGKGGGGGTETAVGVSPVKKSSAKAASWSTLAAAKPRPGESLTEVMKAEQQLADQLKKQKEEEARAKAAAARAAAAAAAASAPKKTGWAVTPSSPSPAVSSPLTTSDGTGTLPGGGDGVDSSDFPDLQMAAKTPEGLLHGGASHHHTGSTKKGTGGGTTTNGSHTTNAGSPPKGQQTPGSGVGGGEHGSKKKTKSLQEFVADVNAQKREMTGPPQNAWNRHSPSSVVGRIGGNTSSITTPSSSPGMTEDHSKTSPMLTSSSSPLASSGVVGGNDHRKAGERGGNNDQQELSGGGVVGRQSTPSQRHSYASHTTTTSTPGSLGGAGKTSGGTSKWGAGEGEEGRSIEKPSGSTSTSSIVGGGTGGGLACSKGSGGKVDGEHSGKNSGGGVHSKNTKGGENTRPAGEVLPERFKEQVDEWKMLMDQTSLHFDLSVMEYLSTFTSEGEIVDFLGPNVEDGSQLETFARQLLSINTHFAANAGGHHRQHHSKKTSGHHHASSSSLDDDTHDSSKQGSRRSGHQGSVTSASNNRGGRAGGGGGRGGGGAGKKKKVQGKTVDPSMLGRLRGTHGLTRLFS